MAQALLSIEGLLHPRAPPLQLRADAAAAAATDTKPLTLGPPRFWSAAAMPAGPALSESAAEGTSPDAMQGLEDAQGGSAHVGSSADAPVAGYQGLVSAPVSTLGAMPDMQPVGSLAALGRAADVAPARTQSAEHAQANPDEAPPVASEPVASPRDQVAQNEQVLNSAEVVDKFAMRTSQAWPDSVPAPASSAVKTSAASALAAPSIIQDHVESDSEGPLPSIDSGPSDSESEE
jgi:hypothetical protein